LPPPRERRMVVSEVVVLQRICLEVRAGAHRGRADVSARILLSVTRR
jgi:hypothetical protein